MRDQPNPNYSNTIIIPNSTSTDYRPTATIGYKTYIYYCTSATNLALVIDENTTYNVALPNVTSTAMAISSDGNKLFIGGSNESTSILSYSIITLNDGLPPIPITNINISNNNISLPAPPTYDIAFYGNAVHRISSGGSGDDLWYAADYNNNRIWLINSSTATASVYATAFEDVYGCAYDGVNLYTISLDENKSEDEYNSKIFYCEMVNDIPSSPLVLAPLTMDEDLIISGIDITYVPVNDTFYIADAGSTPADSKIIYGVIDPIAFTYTNIGTRQLSDLSAQLLTISFSDQGGTNTIRFYSQGRTPSLLYNLYKFYLTNGGSEISGDPEVTTLFGETYRLNSNKSYFKLFDNLADDRIIINCKCWFIGKKELSDYERIRKKKVPDYVKKNTYMRYVVIQTIKNDNTNSLIIDMESLYPVKYTNYDDVQNNKLPINADVNISTNGNINLSKIYKSEKGLYSVMQKKYGNKFGTKSRDITIKSSDCTVNLKLSLNKQDDDRNSIEIKVKGNRELSAKNYSGALVTKSEEWEIADILTL